MPMWQIDDAQIDEAARRMTIGAPRSDLSQRVIREIETVRGSGMATGVARRARWIVPIAAAAAIVAAIRFAPERSAQPPVRFERADIALDAAPPPVNGPLNGLVEPAASAQRPPASREERTPAPAFAETNAGIEMSITIPALEIAALAPPAPIVIDEIQISAIDVAPLIESNQQQD